MNTALPRGMRDFGPKEYRLVEKIRAEFIETADIFGFTLMEPSPIELLTTLEAKSGPSIRDEIYFFKDKSGRSLGLRFDLTVGLTRYVCSRRGLQLPIKLAAFSSMWRYDEPQYGRYRWFYQWDVEVFGSSSIEADAEVIEFTSSFLDRLGLKQVSIEVGDRRVVEEFVQKKLGIDEEEKVLDLFRAVDKVGKKPTDEIVAEYEGKGINKEWLDGLLEFGGIRGEPEDVLTRLGEIGLTQTDSLIELVNSLDSRQVKNVFLNMGIVRGLDYYTGVVYEVFDRSNIELGALAGGGRYDTLPAIFGRRELRATGVAGGVERTALALSRIKALEEEGSDAIYVAYAKKELASAAYQLASKLRRNGVPTEVDLSGRTLRRQLEAASARSIPYVAIVAPIEYSKGVIVLRDMKDGREFQVAIDDLADSIKSRIERHRSSEVC